MVLTELQTCEFIQGAQKMKVHVTVLRHYVPG
jgi:hypothetical protein